MANIEMEEEYDRVLDVVRETLGGDIRDHLLEYQKHEKSPLPWNMLSEEKQRDMVERTEKFVDVLLKRIVQIVRADGNEQIVCQLKGIGTDGKGGIIAKIATPFRQDAWGILGMASTVAVVVADSRSYEGERKPGSKHVQKQQPGLFEEPAGDGAGGEAKDDGPVFDQTAAGKHTAVPPVDPNLPKPDPDTNPAAKRVFETDEATGRLTDDSATEFAKEVWSRMMHAKIEFPKALDQIRKLHKLSLKQIDAGLIDQKVKAFQKLDDPGEGQGEGA